jgi:SAM-dependent methyltransferase
MFRMAAVRTSVRRRWPAAYGQARNVVNLARWVWNRRTAGATDPYDDAFWDFHEDGDWDGMADVVVAFARPISLVDVGCGQGQLLSALRRRCPELPVRGIDSSVQAIARARRRELDVTFADLGGLRRQPPQPVKDLVAGTDVAVCLETAEHLPPWAARPLVEVLTSARCVIFSAAPPGQGGTMHVNEQPLEYWRRRFRRRGFDLDPIDEAFRAAVAALHLPWWYGANIHLLSRLDGPRQPSVPIRVAAI